MLSILIPTYNYDITPLVSSLHEQLSKENMNYEILVADDGSKDAALVAKNKTIENFPHCSYSIHLKNQGRTATRQLLAEKAQYDWLLFLDADVLPKNNTFIRDFKIGDLDADVVFGGISYSEVKPEKSKILRWKYGKAREAKSVSERKKNPHLTLISQSLLIKKHIFLKANTFLDNQYGVDVLFSKNLEDLHAKILHLDNPIVHLGLEDNLQFIQKTKNGLETLAYFSNSGKLPEDYRPVQKAYVKLKNLGLVSFYKNSIVVLISHIEKNLNSSNPSLFLFDLYKLHYYISIINKP